MDKMFYKIYIGGESDGECVRELTKDEFELIDGILTECESEYVGAYIKPAPLKYIVMVKLALDRIGLKQPNLVIFKGNNYVSEYDKMHWYPTDDSAKTYHYFFDTLGEAEAFGEAKAAELGCDFVKYKCYH